MLQKRMSGRILHSERREKSTVQGRTRTDLYDQNQTAACCGPAGECQGTGKSGLCTKGQNQQFAENGRNAGMGAGKQHQRPDGTERSV